VKSANWKNLPEAVRDAALEWRLRLSSPAASDADYAAFGDWIAADPSHVAAIRQIEELDAKLERLRRTDPSQLDHLLDLPAPKRRVTGLAPAHFRRLAAIAATLLLAVVGGGLWMVSQSPRPATVAYASADALRLVTLEDGTTVTLTPGARMDVSLLKHERRVTSFDGVGYFHVAPDKARPFKIALGDRTVTVVGTQFELTNRDGARAVAVAEGVVAVGGASPGADKAEARLAAGHRLTIAPAETEAVIDSVDPATISIWRNGFLEFNNEAVDVVARRLVEIYGASSFGVADEATGQLRFSGVLHLSDAGSVARRLDELLPLTAVERDGKYELMADNPD
jgi:transmembrane sensor